MTKLKICLPFEYSRKPIDPIDEGTLFQILTGKSYLTLFPGRKVTGKVFKFGATAATCIEKTKSKDREKRLEALQSAFGKTKIGDDGMDIDSGKNE